MVLRLVFVGRVAAPRRVLSRGCVLPVARMAAGSAAGLSPAVLVLGDEALAAMPPPRVRETTRGGWFHVVAAPSAGVTSFARAAVWARSDVAEIVDADRLEACLDDLLARHPRPALPHAEWLPRAPATSAGASLAAALDRVHPPTVDAWRRAVVSPPRTFTQRVRRETGLAPRDAVLRYVAAAARRMRAEGLTCARIADALGYSDTRTLLRALRRARDVGDAEPAPRGAPPS